MPKRARAKALLRAAYEYLNAGLMPIPLQGGENAKLPLLRSVEVDFGFEARELNRLYERGWGETPFDWERFEGLFKLAGGIGIACGSCSGGLAVIDFDDPVAHEIWMRENAEVAARMPAVKTARGFHYYFVPAKRLEGGWKGFHVAGYASKAGELKLANGYVAAPPTKHPRGVKYKWRGPSILDRRPPVIDLVELRLTAVGGFSAVEADQESDQADQTGQLIQTLSDNLTLSGGPESVQVEFNRWKQAHRLLRRHLPTRPGTRNRCLLKFVQSLKSIGPLRNSPAVRFRRLIGVWCEKLEERSCVSDASFKTNWASFESAWDNCEFSSDDAFRWHLEGLDLVELSTTDQVRAICERLNSLNDGGEFPLGTIALARVLVKSQTQAMRLLHTLVENRELLLVRRGRFGNRTANTYRLGPEFRSPLRS